MQLSTRDRDVVVFVNRFGQVTLDIVRRYLFATNSSKTPCYRVMNRLVSQKLLARVEIPAVGSPNGGRGPFIYQLGSAGFNMAQTEGTYWQARSINYHSLAIADCFVSLSESLDIVRYEADEEASKRIAYVSLEPDLYVLYRLDNREAHAWLEVDLGTERPKQLKGKLKRYHDALEGASDSWRSFWPTVVWVVPDMKRRAELESLIKLEPVESRGMYRVCLFSDVAKTLLTQ